MIRTFPTETAWLHYRSDPAAVRIGASEVATILGYGFQSPLELWATKRGVSIPIDSRTAAMFRQGHEDEPRIAEWFENETGIELIDPGPYTVIQHPEIEWAFCTPDRVTPDGEPVELKAPRHADWSEWQHEAPYKYWIQLQWQMFCMGAKNGYIAARTCPEVYHEYEFDPAFIESIMPHVEHFRRLVISGTPPQPDGTESAGRAIKALHPKDNGETVDLPELADLAAQLETLRALKNNTEEAYETARQAIALAMGDATFAKCGDKRFSNKTQSRKGTITVPLGYAEALRIAGIKHTITDGCTYRVLRETKSTQEMEE